MTGNRGHAAIVVPHSGCAACVSPSCDRTAWEHHPGCRTAPGNTKLIALKVGSAVDQPVARLDVAELSPVDRIADHGSEDGNEDGDRPLGRLPAAVEQHDDPRPGYEKDKTE
jgi:hypothetical protein